MAWNLIHTRHTHTHARTQVHLGGVPGARDTRIMRIARCVLMYLRDRMAGGAQCTVESRVRCAGLAAARGGVRFERVHVCVRVHLLSLVGPHRRSACSRAPAHAHAQK